MAQVWRHNVRLLLAHVEAPDAEDVPHTRLARGSHAGRGVFHHHTLLRSNPEPACRRQISLGVRLALAHILP